jgi:ribonuclease VapC
LIVVDTSAIAAIYFGESDAARFADVLWSASQARISAGTALEVAIVLGTRKRESVDVAGRWLDDFLADAGIVVEPVDVEQMLIARHAYSLYGKGTGHKAQLNFGDCFAYALAKALDAPLLYKGVDFAHTDIGRAL